MVGPKRLTHLAQDRIADVQKPSFVKGHKASFLEYCKRVRLIALTRLYKACLGSVFSWNLPSGEREMNFPVGRGVDNADFEAEIAILTADQGGRTLPPLNGIRWDFAYPEDPPSFPIYMIHPFFIDDTGRVIPAEQKLFGTLKAIMFIIAEQAVEYHRKRIFVGMPFECREGHKIVALGTVTKLIRLGVVVPETPS